MPRSDFLYVYILLCADGTFYVGVTNNPDRRLAEHNEGRSEKSYTYFRRPCQMVYQRRFRNFMDALAREKQIKRWSHAKKQALIEGNIDELKRLAQCRNETHHRRLGFARQDGDDEVPPMGQSSTPDGVDDI